MRMEVRDFSAAKVTEIENFLNSYYGDLENSWLYTLGAQLWAIIAGWARDSYHGDYDAYMRAYTAARREAEAKIRALWNAVADVEKRECMNASQAKQMTSSYVNILTELKSYLNVSSFSGILPVGGIMENLQDDYLKNLECKAQQILDGAMPFSDEDMEVLGYVYTNTAEANLREKILSAFYTKTTQYKGYRSGDFAFFYVRDEEQWKKFSALVDYYTIDAYQGYLQMDPDSAEYSEANTRINEILRNQTQLHAMDKASLLCQYSQTTNKPVVQIVNGEVAYDSPVLNIFNETSSAPFPSPSPMNRGDYTIRSIHHHGGKICWIEEGADAGQHISEEVAEELRQKNPDFNMGKKVLDIYKTIGEKGLDIILPGSGEIIGAIDNVVGTINDVADIVETNEAASKQSYAKAYYVNYVNMFEMKCVSAGDYYTFLPTPETSERVELFNKWLEENKDAYPELYNQYYPNMCTANSPYSPNESVSFFMSKNGGSLMNDLSDANALNDWKNYLEANL